MNQIVSITIGQTGNRLLPMPILPSYLHITHKSNSKIPYQNLALIERQNTYFSYKNNQSLSNVIDQKIRRILQPIDVTRGFLLSYGLQEAGIGQILLKSLQRFKIPLFVLFQHSCPQNISNLNLQNIPNSILSYKSLIEYKNVTIPLDPLLIFKRYQQKQDQYYKLIRDSLLMGNQPQNQNPYTLSKIQHTLIPFPRLHFIKNRMYSSIFQKVTYKNTEIQLVAHLKSQLKKHDKIYSFAAVGIGIGLQPIGIEEVLKQKIYNMKNSYMIQKYFESLIQKGLTVFNLFLKQNKQKSLCLYSNEKHFEDFFQELSRLGQKILVKKSFIHYLKEDGMQQSYLQQCVQQIKCLIQDYKNLENQYDQQQQFLWQ